MVCVDGSDLTPTCEYALDELEFGRVLYSRSSAKELFEYMILPSSLTIAIPSGKVSNTFSHLLKLFS